MIITIELIYILVVFGVVVAQMENTTTTANTLKHYPETDWYHDNRLVSNIAWRRWISRIGTIQRAIHTQHRWNQTFDWAHAVQVLDSIFSLYPLFSSSFISFHFFLLENMEREKIATKLHTQARTNKNGCDSTRLRNWKKLLLANNKDSESCAHHTKRSFAQHTTTYCINADVLRIGNIF